MAKFVRLFLHSVRSLFLCGLTALVLTPLANAQDAAQTLEKCSKKFGTLAVQESQTGYSNLSQYGLGSPAALLRMMVEQSGCFDVVERGSAMQNLQQERALAAADEMRQGSNIGKGQLQAADFVMTPNIQVAASDTGGVGGALFGRLGIVGAVIGGLKFKEASTSLLISDVRSGIQVASAEGMAKKTEFSIGGLGFGGGGGAALGGYTRTPEGKMIAASLLDNYNKIVLNVRDKSALIRPSSESSDANAAASTQAGPSQQAGQMLVAKIGNVRVFEQPDNTSKVLATLQKTDELVATGEQKNGFIKVDSAKVSGWVQRTLVMPLPTGGVPTGLVIVQPQAPVGGVYGVFEGSFSGVDSGTFSVTTYTNGLVTGSGVSPNTGYFSVAGRIDPSGALVLNAGGEAGAATYQGRIDPATGIVSGVWTILGNRGGGTFIGRRKG